MEIHFPQNADKTAYHLSKNFTVQYGEDEEEYYYLVIDWNPESIIKKLTENPDMGIADLSMEEKKNMT